MSKRSKPTFYIKTDTFWQNSPITWYGPFDGRQEAEEYIEAQRDWVRPGESPANIKDAVRVYGVYGKSQAVKLGYRAYALGDLLSNDYDEIEYDGYRRYAG